jgi:hypothetical protein
LRGVGMRISIFCARSEGLKLDLTTTLTSIFVRPTSRTNGITRKGNEMSLVVRYLQSKITLVTINSMYIPKENRLTSWVQTLRQGE